MPSSDWEDLLIHSGIPKTTRSGLIRELDGGTSAGMASFSGVSAGANTSAASAQEQQQGASKELSDQLSSLVAQTSSLNSTQQAAISALQGNTQAVTQNTSAKGSRGTSAASQAGGILESLFGGMFSLTPIVSGIMSLFGGGSSAQKTEITPYLLPAPIQYEAGLSAQGGGAVTPVSYSQGGQPRTQAASQAPQITVQVTAMDSQSFLDHSDKIASAVRSALLNANALSDVIADL